ncbi:MAG: hypothetical protein CMM15_01745 [Rhodospirillaceae bacterium]|nr:hypothetical protein [Rhodospirillaceae bacterium]
MYLKLPPTVFRVVWPILYSLLVVVATLFYVYPPTNPAIAKATEWLFWLGIGLNLIWPTIYFRLQWKSMATVISFFMLLLAVSTLVLFAKSDSSVQWVNFTLFSFYTGWIFFATVLLVVNTPYEKMMLCVENNKKNFRI